MTEASPGARARACPRCGALNGGDFERCIRCGTGLFGAAAAADRLAGPRSGDRMPSAATIGPALIATKVIGGLTALIFVGQLVATFTRDKTFALLGGGHRTDMLRFGVLELRTDLVIAEPWRLVSAVFVHFGIIHFGLNMMALFNLARVAEPAVGPARFTIAYVLTGIVGFATTFVLGALTSQDAGMTAGASGAVFGIMGLILGFLVRRRDPRWKQFAMQAVVYSVLFGFGINFMNVGVQVNNSAHLGGLAAGVALGLLYGGAPRRARSDTLVNVGAGVALLVCVGSLIAAQVSPRWQRYEMPDPFESRARVPGDPALIAPPLPPV